ncbi:MAG TPA: DUF167 domain-containing protein [Solirubrobacteraceae bacterium]|nr:DUF167 domain-containing protein [Solirubrobacteraceae bacterium]
MRLTPRAGRDAIDGVRDGVVLARVAAPAHDGRANEALRRLLARQLGVSAGAVTLVRGARSREKLVEVAGLDEAAVSARIARAAR